jgi:hypothetical protein
MLLGLQRELAVVLVDPLVRERALEPVQELRGRIDLVVVLAQPRFGLNRPPKPQDVNVVPFLPLFIAGRPSGNRFFMNGHDLDARRNYALPSTCHTGVDNTTIGKLEHNIAGLRPNSTFSTTCTKRRPALGQRMLFIECEHRHLEQLLWPLESLEEHTRSGKWRHDHSSRGHESLDTLRLSRAERMASRTGTLWLASR